MIEIVASFGLLSGTFFVAMSGLGLIRFPDVYGRLHAVTKGSTLGLAGVLLASAVLFGADGHLVLPELLTMLFVFIGNPIGGHMIGRSAYLIGVPMTEISVIDEMQRAGEQADQPHDQR